MVNPRLFTGGTRSVASFGLLLCLLLSLNGPVEGQQTQRQGDANQKLVDEDGTSLLDASVVEVQDSTVTTEGGILIDVSRALIFSSDGAVLDKSSIKLGTRIRVTAVVPANATEPLVAKFVQVRMGHEVLLVGPLQSVEGFVAGVVMSGGSISLLNRRIRIDNSTPVIFGPGRRKLKIGRTVTVIARQEGEDLVAIFISTDDRYAFGVGPL
jgi:hypothetical protein